MQFITKPWSHQEQISNYLSTRLEPYYALFWDMGTGKTKQACDIIRIACYELNRVPKVLIVCPVVVLENWKREIEMHTNIPVGVIQVVDGCTKPDGKKNKNPTKKLKLLQVSDERKEIFVISTETVDSKKESVWHELRKLGFEMLIIDEAHLFKNYKGVRTKALHSFTHDRKLKWRYILTGTPILQDALDLWSQFYILNPAILGANYFQFRSRYFYDKNAGMPSHLHFPDYVPKDEAYFELNGYDEEQDLQNLKKIIYKHAHRIMKNEVLELPPLHYEKRVVQMEGEQKRIYEEFKRDLVAFVKKPKKSKKELEAELLAGGIDLKEFELPDTMKADLAIVKTIRLQQLIAGIFTNTEGEITILPTQRIIQLEEELSLIHKDPANKSIVWSIFKPTYEEIAKVCKKLKLKYVFLNGLQNKEEKQAAVDAFQTDPTVQVIIANQAAGGTGVNLTAANYNIYYTRGFSLAQDMQSEARPYRGGQTREVFRIDFITEDTIDERAYERVKHKKKHAEDILEHRDFNRKELLNLI